MVKSIQDSLVLSPTQQKSVGNPVFKQLANLAPLCKIANKNKANAYNFINALIKVCQASKVIKKEVKFSDNKSITSNNKSPFVQKINLENESVKDQVMSEDLSPSKNNSYPNENSIDNFGIMLKDLNCANNFSETNGSIINNLVKNKYQYSNYDFCYRRSAYRSMMDFYKDKFKPILIEWKAGERRSVKSFV